MPRAFANSNPREYSPAWDLQVGVYSDAAVTAGLNGLQTDAETVLGLAAEGVVTAPGGLPLGSANIVINCPALAVLDGLPLDPTSGVAAGGGGTASQADTRPVDAVTKTGQPAAGDTVSSSTPPMAGVFAAALALAGILLLRRSRVVSGNED
jgi:hypothetical protein